MNTSLERLQVIDYQLQEITKAITKYDPGAGISLYVNRPGGQDSLEVEVADGLEVLKLIKTSLENSKKHMMALARIDMHELMAYLNAAGALEPDLWVFEYNNGASYSTSNAREAEDVTKALCANETVETYYRIRT